MCKKSISLISFAFVLGLVPTSAANAADPNLVGYWTFDEGSGTTAYDSSGYGNHGTITGAERVAGKLGGALSFNGVDFVAVPADAWLPIERQVTVAFWAYGDPDFQPQENCCFGANQDPAVGTSRVAQCHVPWSNGRVYWDSGGRIGSTSDRIYKQAVPADYEGSWQHWAFTKDADAGEMKIYLNGLVWHSGTGTTRPMTGVAVFMIGSASNGEANYDGMIDDFQLYNRALTEAEIQQAMTGVIVSSPAPASNPSPTDKATDVPRDVVLSWTPGEYAPAINGHKVHLSENFDDVHHGIAVIGTQDANSYDPGGLDLGATYYWRIDEANNVSGWDQGNVWQFTVEPIGYPVPGTSITVTASSSNRADMGPENTVNGSGLDADNLHSAEATDMWLSSSEPLGAWIQYEFDKVYKLHQMWVWNSNQLVESLTGFGLKDVTIEYSADGIEWMQLGAVPEFAQAPSAAGYAHNTTVDFGGEAAKYVKITANSNWGVLTQYGLSEVRFFYIPIWAREPYPDSGATDISIGTIDEPIDVTLGFRAGREAVKHDVYLSSDEQAVIDRAAPVTTVTEPGYGPLSLDVGKTYYWRVDEVNEAESPTIWPGDIWNFTTQEYFVVDDFEDYNDYPPDEIFSTWIDGWGTATNGSTVGYPDPIFAQGEHFVETMIVHGGKQSMPFYYDNTAGATYSEAELALSPAQDWSKSGIQTLSLWFYGDPNNSVTEQMYVKLNGFKVAYDGDAADIKQASWKQWTIDLASLGLDLRNVTKLVIGFGDETNLTPGGSGVMYFDDIRLYPLREPEADLAGN